MLLIRPKIKKDKEHRKKIDNLKRGDKVITTGGIIGTIKKVSETKEYLIDISDDVEIKVARGGIFDLYISPDKVKNNSSSENSKEKKGGLLTGLFGNKK